MGANYSTSQNNVKNFKNSSNDNKKIMNKISLEEAYESLEDIKEAINNVYCLNKLLYDYIDDIEEEKTENVDNPINAVLSKTLHDNYDKNSATNYCEIIELARNMQEVNSCRMLFSCKQYDELDGLHVSHIKTKNTNEMVDNVSFANVGKLLEMRIIDMSKRIPAYGNTFICCYLGMWTKGIRCYFNLLRKHPLNEDKWIMISSGINMKDYTNHNTTNLSLFSAEYKILIENITQVMNSNAYLNIIETSSDEAAIIAEEAIKDSEEKTALYNVHKKVFETAPNDPYARAKLQDATIAGQSASRYAANAITNAKAAQTALTEAEAHVAAKTTTWEYGTSENHNNLRCIYSGIHPQWNGMLIRDCVLRDSRLDMAAITLNIMRDIEKNYKELFNNQMILCSYKTVLGYYISIVKIIKHGEDIHIQLKEAYLNTIFNEKREYGSENNSYQSNNNIIVDKRPERPSAKSYVFIDPTTNFIGIGTNSQVTNYEDDYITTKMNNLQHVVIKSKYYPNVVNTRIAEDADFTKDEEKNYYYFDQFSSSTMRRESNLYNFSEIIENSRLGSEQTGIKQRYGNDISFELADNTKNTYEIGSLGMVIDKVDDDGLLYGGFSVKTVPNVEKLNDKDTVKPGNTIMYVSSEGTLHISGIMLGSKLLTVKNEGGKEILYWGDKKIK